MIAALVLALTFPYVNHAATPQATALGVLFPRTGVTVVRVNIAGNYATVLTRGAVMEGAPLKGALLLEHFSFGWQTLTLLDYCHVGKGFSARDWALLMQGMPEAKGNRECFTPSDSGPQSDVEAVRLLMRGPLIPDVVVCGEYAMGEWYGAGGGQSLYRRDEHGWKLVTTWGGAINASELERFGVPRNAACVFAPYDKSCPS